MPRGINDNIITVGERRHFRQDDGAPFPTPTMLFAVEGTPLNPVTPFTQVTAPATAVSYGLLTTKLPLVSAVTIWLPPHPLSSLIKSAGRAVN